MGIREMQLNCVPGYKELDVRIGCWVASSRNSLRVGSSLLVLEYFIQYRIETDTVNLTYDLKNDVNQSISEESSRQPLFSGRSYIVALSVWEQLMASAFNYVQLQCWAKSLHTSAPITPVEPQLKSNSSVLGFSFTDDSVPVVASDVFDMDSWDSQWPKHGPPLAPLTPRTHFIEEIKNFHKNVIIVQLIYGVSNEGECPFTWNISSLNNDLHQYPLLNVKRKVCIRVAKQIPAKEFSRLVFSNLETSNTLVVIDEWRGIRGGRIYIKGSPCIVTQPPYSNLKPSVGVLKDAEAYASKHLGGFGQYVSVSARFEKVIKKYWQLSLKKLREAVAVGIKEALAKLKNMKKRVETDNIYLAYDFGPFGSLTFKGHKYYNSSDLLVKFQEDVYGGRLSYSEYEKSLTTFKSQNPGYVAMVQMTLSSRGKCLLQVGWGHCIEFVKAHFRVFNAGNNLCLECAPRSVCTRH